MKYSNFCLLENNDYKFDQSVDSIAGLGSITSIIDEKTSSISDISTFQTNNQDWIFGHIAYDLKNKTEQLYSENIDRIGFSDFFLFVPEIVIIISKDTVSIGVHSKEEAQKILEEIDKVDIKFYKSEKSTLQPRFDHQEYLKTVASLQDHIARGDCYEVCFCVEYYSENCTIHPIEIFLQLNKLSPNPFAAFYKVEEKFLLCASPERFLKKKGMEVISQPIKGTLKRTGESSLSDKKEKQQLLNDEKERAENIMIVDLVRNDLSKICKQGSVKVRDFLEIHSFPQVHQMISTISGQVDKDCTFGEILQATFPMGSMTGAPKVKAMQLIEQYEKTRRGLFSGSIGYITPQGDFDFNVVIRSLLYNEEEKYLSCQVGSAITSKSNAEKEFEECSAKIEAIITSLS
ncbi:MAG: anthranilate synthase component I family protein [Ginsengibacter sp.]